MGLIAVENVEPGMKLTGDLHSPNGRFLLPAGTVLQDKHVRILKIWGVTEADIEGLSQEDVREQERARLDPAVLRQSSTYISSLFDRAGTQPPVLHELYELAVIRTAHRITDGSLEAAYATAVNHSDFQNPAAESDRPCPSLAELADKEHELVALPDIFHQITDAINNPNSSSAYIANVIAKDMALSVKLLRLVNSAFYGFPRKIDTLSMAITVIGSKQLTMVAIGISLINTFRGIPDTLIDMKAFWQHSFSCGIISRLVAEHLHLDDSERFFVAGLLHDVGRLIMLKNYPGEAVRAFARSARESELLADAEKNVWGYDHAQIGAMMFERWKLPAALEHGVGYHHKPSDSGYGQEAAIVHVADIITHALALGNSGCIYVPPLDEKAWSSLGLSKNVLNSLIPQVDFQLGVVMKMLFAQ